MNTSYPRSYGSAQAMRYVCAMVMMLFGLGIGNAWGVTNGYGILHLTSETPAKGLVYANKDNNAPTSDNQYAASSDSGEALVCNSDGSAPRDFYGWAKGARGWQWTSWQIGETVSNPTHDNAGSSGTCTLKSTAENGNVAASVFTLNGGRNTSSERLVTANWKEDGNATITYAQTVGGSYNVNYQYVKVNTSTNKFTSVSKDYTVSPTSGDVKPSETTWDGTTIDNRSYVNDKITLSTTAANLLRWEEVNAANNAVTNLTPTVNGTTRSYVYQVVDGRTATIRAVFKSASLGEISGNKQISVDNLTKVYDYSLKVSVTDIIGDWVAGDFTVVFQNKSGAATFTKGSAQYAAGLLTIPFTYQANAEGNTTIDVVVSTPYGAQTSCQIVATAEVTVDYEAQILLAGQTDPSEGNTGTLSAMLTKANGMSGDFTLKLMNPVSITEPLSFTNTFTFDINGKAITSSGNAAISVDAADINVHFIDGSFIKAGTITAEKSLDGVIRAVRYTAAGKITLDGGTIIANNTSTAAGAKAYAVNVSNGGVFFMTAGSYGRVSAVAENEAVAIYVNTTSDYATMNGGVVEASAKANAFGLWSAGVANITDATINVETQTGANAYGVYVNGSTTTLTNTTINVLAKTTQAYGAYVEAGRLNMNGGAVVADANSDAYGVHVAALATASVLMRADIAANATSAGNARGLNNLGTLIANNANVHVTATTTSATAVNTEISAISTTIDGGLYIATSGGGTVYGLHHQYGDLSVDGGEFHGIATGGSSAYGARTVANGTIENATLWGETQGVAHTAYGYVAGTAGKTAALTRCVIKAESAAATAYAIYSRAIVEATDCELTATTNNGNKAVAFWAEDGTNTITRCNGAVTASEAEAWGVNHLAGACTISGGSYTVLARQAKASAEGDTKAYGVQNAASKTTNISDATFSVTGNNTTYAQNVYGLYVSGIVNCTNSTFDVKSRINAYGVYGDDTSYLNLSGNKFDATAITTTGAYGMYSNKNFTTNNDLFSATATTTSAYALSLGSSAKGTVLNGKFAAVGTGNFGPINRSASTTNVVLKGGFYTTSTNLLYYTASGCDVFRIDKSEAEYTEGYRYVIAEENPARFVCYIGDTGYATLEAAMQYTIDNPLSSGSYTIVMSQPYILPAGNYTLPSYASLLIPYKDNQTTISTTPTHHDAAEVIAEYIRLTVASGVNWNVDGRIEVSSKMFCAEGVTSYVNGPYGCLELKENSTLQLNSGAKMYAWGFVVGSGNIKAKGGAEVREFFQALDIAHIGTLYDHLSDFEDLKYFPCSQYFIQNIEAPTTYYYNSKLITSMYIGYKGDEYGTDNVKLVGTPTNSSDNYLFQIVDNDESSWVRKEYNATRDRQVWTVGSKAQLGAMTLTISGIPLMGSFTLNSKDYILPLTSNMTINTVEGGRLELTQSMELLAGAEININKTASLIINQKDSKNADVNFYVIDASESFYSTKYVNFSPSWPRGNRPSRSVPDAAINVSGGEIVVKGNLYTTASGANIYSNNDNAGTVSFQKAAPAAGTLSYYSSGTKTKNITPAQLKNGNGTYTSTASAIAGMDHGYMNDAWHSSYVNGPFTVIDNIVYAKPSEYTQLMTQQTGTNGKLEGVAESNHTYLTIDDKILILQGKGTDASPYEWWEVVATATAGVFECQKPGYEGFYSYNTTAGEWQIVKRNVTFYMDEAKTESTKKVVSVNYMGVPDQSVITSNPTKGITTGYTYQFYGWKSSVTTTEYAWTETLEAAENDMYYTPVFTATKRNYTITLNNAYNGDPVYLEVPYEEMPEYTPRKDATAQYTYTFNGWSPEFTTVTGTATYTAQWLNTINRYTVTWKNGETTLETDKNQAYGATPTYNGDTPSKEADNYYAYTFDGWSLTDGGDKLNSLPSVSGETTYYAHYSTTPRYMVTFANYDGTQLQKEPVTQGVNPVYGGLMPARARDLDGYYKFIGWKNSAGTDYAANATLPAVTAKETYTAQYDYVTELYLITLNNIDGNGGTWSGKFGEGATPFYNPDNNDVPVEPAKAGNAQYYYEFTGWSPALQPVTGTASYTAQFEQHTMAYDITFANVDGNGATRVVAVEYGTVPACPVTPEKSNGCDTYEFLGWNTTPVAVTGVATYTATFSATPTKRQFPITFDLDNGTTPTVVDVECGQTPSWTGATPTKSATAQYTYTFTGWYPTLYPVDGEESYIALYSQTVNKYTVTFKNYDGTVLQSSQVAYGATPSAPANPTRPQADGYAYTFSGWSPSVTSVTGNATYTAQYNATALVASVTTSSDVTTYYSSWADAFNDANTNSTGNCILRIYQNVTATNNTTISKNMTIDLNGHTISCTTSTTSNTQLFYINSAVTLTINDSQGGGGITYSGSGNATYYAIYNNASGTININGGTIQVNATNNNRSCKSAAIYLRATSCTLNMHGGEITATKTNGSATAYAVYFRGSSYASTVNIYGTAKLNAANGIFQNGATGNNTKVTLYGGYYSADPGTSGNSPKAKLGEGYEQVSIANASADPEYSNGYRHKVVPKSYTLTWNLDGGTVTTAGTVAAVNATGSPSGSVAYTTALTAPVVERVGYIFFGWNTTVAATMPASNTTYTAQWTPRTDTEYKVKHYKQKLDGSYDATPDDTDNLQGTTAANVTPAVKSYTGFTAPGTQTKAIAADGSLVITYQYTRNSYLLTWNLDGGKVTTAGTAAAVDETEPSDNVKYETPITAPVVSRVGYTFAGWNTSIASTMPTSALTYTATWTPNTNTPYAVKHYKQNVADDNYTLFETENKTGTTATEVTPAVKSYTGFTAPSTQTKAIAADGSLVITYQYTRNSYLLTWNLDGGKVTTAGTAAAVDETEPSDNVKYETAITAPVVSRVGYTFNGWNTSIASTMPAAATTYTATWTPNTNTPYTIKHYKQKLDGTYASTPDDTDNLTGTTATSVTPDRKSYEGFTAPSGQTVTILADGSRVVTYNYTRNSYTLAWTTDGDDLTGTYTSGSTLYEASITTPNTPTKTGYTFAAWSPTPAATMPAEDTEYTATWTPNTDTKYTVKHWQQNIANDDYTEVTDDREELEGTTATTTTASANTYTGFTAQPISQGTIAADGSAVVNVYYNRNKYTITWLDGDGTTIETDENVKYGATPSYDGSTPTKSDDEYCTYEFAGEWTPAIVAVTGNQTYTALFDASVAGAGYGLYLDIVDWTKNNDGTAGTLTINANTWVGSGWPYTINGIAYDKTDRAEDRTLTIPYSGGADAEFGIVVTNKNGGNYSIHRYTIPHICNSASVILSNTQTSSIVYVSDGKLTVNATTKVGAIYVAPDAELVVNSGVTLTVDSLILRTTAWKAASLENSGTVTVTSGKTYYTRIVSDNSQYYQFALPLASSIKGMHLSDYSKCTYGTSWILKSYRESSRANNGVEDSNWQLLSKPDGDADVTIAPKIGYELSSNSPYYREFYFPVDLASLGEPEVEVTRTTNGAAGPNHAGWNAICSPLLGKFTQNYGDHPEDALKVSFLTEEGYYWQYVPQTIHPAIPFYYQATQAGILEFSQYMHYQQAPQRAWNASVPTQWLQVSVSDVNGKMLDQTNIYSHPEKFSVAYETGYDVAKQSTEGGRAVIYTELACGKLAFAAIPDSLAETRVPLTVYAGAGSEYVFTLEDNGYTRRLQYVLLHDTETGSITDLMSGSYTAELTQGTTAGRFYIQCVFREDAPAIATGTENTDVLKEVGQKIIYNEKIFILYRGRVYDMTGRQCELH